MRPERGSVVARRKGSKLRSLVELQPANTKFERLLNYRYYRIRLRAVLDVKDKISTIRKNTAYLRYHVKFFFSGEDPILVLEFLATMVEQFDNLLMSEVGAYATLHNFPKGTARDQFISCQRIDS